MAALREESQGRRRPTLELDLAGHVNRMEKVSDNRKENTREIIEMLQESWTKW